MYGLLDKHPHYRVNFVQSSPSVKIQSLEQKLLHPKLQAIDYSTLGPLSMDTPEMWPCNADILDGPE